MNPRERAGARAGTVALLFLVACGGADGRGETPPGDTAVAEAPAAERGAGTAEAPAAQEAGGDVAARSADAGTLTPIDVAGHTVRVEIADEADERQRGLMYRESLPEDQGMLFVYEDERDLSFWMRNTQLPLDIAFLDREGRIVDIQQLEPFDENSITTRSPAMYALEMNRGWFEEHGVEIGDRVRF